MNTSNVSGLREFVAEAIAAGWPDNTFPRKDVEFAGFYSSHYQRDLWRYLDLWSGATTDMGMQVVFHDEHPIWCCTYRGGITAAEFLSFDSIESNPVFSFLATAMRLPGNSALPLRGPAEHTDKDGWTYTFDTEGNIDSFFAIERITLRERNVYERTFTGGSIGNGVPYGESIESLIRRLIT